MEYAFDVELPHGWSETRPGRFHNDSPWMRLTVRSQILPIGYAAADFFHLVQDDLRRDWWPTASLFEIVAVEDATRDGHPARRIRYRVQESSEFCALAVEELLLVADVLPGHPHGFRLRLWTCEHTAAAHGETIENILGSYQITTQPATYYTKFMSVAGVTVKAAGHVDSAAVEAGAEIVATMLSGREDLPICMFREGGSWPSFPSTSR